MMFAAIQPARLANGAASNDLENVIHRCEQCGATLIRTMRSPPLPPKAAGGRRLL
jgi:hypothetical protein